MADPVGAGLRTDDPPPRSLRGWGNRRAASFHRRHRRRRRRRRWASPGERCLLQATSAAQAKRSAERAVKRTETSPGMATPQPPFAGSGEEFREVSPPRRWPTGHEDPTKLGVSLGSSLRVTRNVRADIPCPTAPTPSGQARAMARRRPLPTPRPWALDRQLRAAAEELLDDDDEAIDARAALLGVDPARLAAFVADARRRLRSS